MVSDKGLLYSVNDNLYRKFRPLAEAGERHFDFMGGRRSGKTYFILQFLIQRAMLGEIVNVATMTSEQGRLGAYADTKDIINGTPSVQPLLEIMTNPREIRCKHNRGQMFFNSYPDPEHAKGIACDWLYINEGNNFTEQQYIDLAMSVRKGVFVDRNPNSECWTEKHGFTLIHSTWQDNKENLSEEQLQQFARLKAAAESPNATQADIAFYKMYYLGEYAEIVGSIFTPANLVQESTLPEGLYSPIAFADPSALRGADYFAMVLGLTDGHRVYIADTFSENTGGYQLPATKLQEWQRQYPGLQIFVETNGLAGIEFYEFAQNSGIDVQGWVSKGNKFERITGNYQGILTQVVWVSTPPPFLAQVYAFDKKCEHDDNIDAANSLLNAYKWQGLID